MAIEAEDLTEDNIYKVLIYSAYGLTAKEAQSDEITSEQVTLLQQKGGSCDDN